MLHERIVQISALPTLGINNSLFFLAIQGLFFYHTSHSVTKRNNFYKLLLLPQFQPASTFLSKLNKTEARAGINLCHILIYYVMQWSIMLVFICTVTIYQIYVANNYKKLFCFQSLSDMTLKKCIATYEHWSFSIIEVYVDDNLIIQKL